MGSENLESAAVEGGAGILSALISASVDLWAMNKQEKQAKEMNKIYGEQYAQERKDKLAFERWQKNFYDNKEKFDEYQTNLNNVRTWAVDLQNTVNNNQALKSQLVNIWNKSRSF